MIKLGVCVSILLLATAPAAAQSLTFSNAPSAARDTAERLLEVELGEDIESDYVSVAEVDIDLDGKPELFAFADWTYFCGSAGCIPRLYVRTNDAWTEVDFLADGFINSEPQMWSLAPEMANNHVVFVLTGAAVTSRFEWVRGAYVERSD